MSGALRRASGLVLQRLGNHKAGQSLQQKRYGSHDLGVHNNKYVEEWMSRREDIEREFRWTNKTVFQAVTMLVVVPVAMYNAICWRSREDDRYGGRQPR